MQVLIKIYQMNMNIKFRENICRHPLLSRENCDTLGLAELGTMCNLNSCAIVQVKNVK